MFNFGIGRSYGAAEFSAGYQYNTCRTNNQAKTIGRVISLGASYKWMEGLKPFVAMDLLNQTTNNAAVLLTSFEGAKNVNPTEYDIQEINNNKGAVVMGGFKVTF